MQKFGQDNAESMCALEALLCECGARWSEPLTLDSKLATLGLDSLGYVQLWTAIADSDFPINALLDADIADWNLRDVLYFSHLQQKKCGQKLFQRRLRKAELGFVIAKCLECGSESGSAVSALAKSLKVAYKHCVCEGFYMKDCKRNAFAVGCASELPSLPKVTRQRRASASFDADLQSAQGFYTGDCQRKRLQNDKVPPVRNDTLSPPSLAEGARGRGIKCLGFFIAFVQPKNIYIPIIWVDSKHQNKAISVLIWRNLAPLLVGRTLSAPLWARQHFARYVVSETDGILTLDSNAIAQRFKNGTLQQNQE